MKTLQTMLVGIFVAAATTAAADAPNLATITITAKRPHAGVTSTERVPPQSTIEIVAPLPTDMPEAEIDYHMSPIGVPPAPAVPGVRS
jgi:hypothetical protein